MVESLHKKQALQNRALKELKKELEEEKQLDGFVKLSQDYFDHLKNNLKYLENQERKLIQLNQVLSKELSQKENQNYEYQRRLSELMTEIEISNVENRKLKEHPSEIP